MQAILSDANFVTFLHAQWLQRFLYYFLNGFFQILEIDISVFVILSGDGCKAQAKPTCSFSVSLGGCGAFCEP